MTQSFTTCAAGSTPASNRDAVLLVLGTLQGERRLVVWASQSAYLTPKCFKFLSKLAVAAVAEPGRWVKREELERGDNQARYLYRLRGELESQCSELPELWENNRRGSYRLTLDPDRIQVDWDTLLDNDDWDLVAWVRAFAHGAGAARRLPWAAESGQTAAA
jgi:hypothetical protein